MNVPVIVKEVAAHAGVSVATVSNVLNRPEIVAQATRERVNNAIRKLGFVRNESARQLRVPLTSVRQPRRHLGRTAARLLLDEAPDGDSHSTDK